MKGELFKVLSETLIMCCHINNYGYDERTLFSPFASPSVAALNNVITRQLPTGLFYIAHHTLLTAQYSFSQLTKWDPGRHPK